MDATVQAASQEVYRRARRAQATATSEALRHPLGADELTEGVAADLWTRTDALAAASPARTEHACSKGCRWCCHQPVLVGAPEAIALASELGRTFGPLGRERLAEAIAQRARRVGAGPDWRTRWLADRLPCAFLAADGSCAIHARRPAICRGYHSLSRQACEQRYAGDGGVLPVDRASHLGANGLLHGMLDASRQSGRDHHLYELHGAVLHALTDAGCARRWTGGGDAFPGLWRMAVEPEADPAAQRR